MLFANEENGLRGGRAYAEAHKDELERHVAAIEADSGGGKPSGFGVTAGAGGVDMVSKLVAPLKALGAAEATDGGVGADISPMKAARVPMLLLRQETSNYFDYHHSAADTLDKVDRHDLDKCVGLTIVLHATKVDFAGRQVDAIRVRAPKHNSNDSLLAGKHQQMMDAAVTEEEDEIPF